MNGIKEGRREKTNYKKKRNRNGNGEKEDIKKT